VSKAAVSNLTKTLALEWSNTGVNVNAIAPGPIETPSRAERYAKPEIRSAVISKLAIPRLGQASDIVGPAIFLASKAAGFITGETLLADGGYCAQ
jgi:NAD(P)-dependent dehydrogenase (short-subunit alcohol dehydrogenase family)